MARAVIICPHESGRWHDHWQEVCLAHCRKHGYEIVGVTETWSSAKRMLDAREAEIVVVAKRGHLPPSLEPRLEVVAEQR